LADFFLTHIGKGTYIEYFGMSDEKYLGKKTKKQKFYKRNGYYLVETTEKDMNMIDDILDQKIQKEKKDNVQ